MSNRKLYALLCGINDYTPNVGSLHGCLNDVDAYEAWLSERFPVDQRSIEILKDSAATRRGIIDGFRQHLAQATANDIVLFQFAGHGARWKSAPQFLSYYPDGFDEGLVCWDSRRDPTAAGSYDLADKELAVLVAEVASRCPHVAVLLDCCHSGSGTRGADDFAQMAIRLTHQVDTPRPLESYLDGHYKRLHECNKGLANVASQHILLAACERKKQAFEGYDRRGIFSSTLLERLSQSGGAITYADLFLQVRATVQRKAFNQTPQFEVFRGFDGHQGFLGASVNRSSKQRYLVRRDSVAKQWTVDFGSIQGLLVEQDKPLEFRIYGSQALANAESSLIQRLDDPSEASVEPSRVEAAIGGATAVQVGLTKSVIELDFAPPKDQLFYAEVTSLPSLAIDAPSPNIP